MFAQAPTLGNCQPSQTQTPSSPPPPYTYTPATGVNKYQLVKMLMNPEARAVPPPAPKVDVSSVLSNAQVHSDSSVNADVFEETSSEELSAIEMHVDASIVIKGNNNVVLLDSSPAERADSVFMAISKALQEHSSGRCGIPMIDEDGRPRPIHIKANVGMKIDGAHNLVGNEKLIQTTQDPTASKKRSVSEDANERPAKRCHTASD
jgi:hypothetical protein